MITKDKLFWGKPCRRHGHQKEDGTNLRHVDRTCMMCNKGDKLGLTQDELYIYLINPKPPKRTPEEKAAGAVAASMRWNARNKDKVKEYTSKYNAKPERKAVIAKKNSSKWFSMTPEERKEKSREVYARYKEKHPRPPREPGEARPPRTKRLLDTRTSEEKHSDRLAKERERYARLTPEQKADMFRKQKARRLAKEAKDKDET
jgi:hypothetical protein